MEASQGIRRLLVALFIALPATTRAQATGAIAGAIADGAGQPVSNAAVVATSATGLVRRDLSGVDGRFRLGLLPAGEYSVSAQKVGYRPSELVRVTVRAGSTESVALVMGRAATTLGPVVASAAPNEIRKEDTRLGTRIDEGELATLPVGYDFQSIISFTPGARPGQVWGGSTEQANSYVVDGVSLNHPGAGGSFLSLNPSWLEQIEVTGLGGGAEIGNFQGGLIRAVTKSGSNTRAGTLRVNGESRRLNGSNIGSTEIRGEIAARREIEGEVRGPIVRDRLFYYVSGQLVQRDVRSIDNLRGPGYVKGVTTFLPTLASHDETKAFAKATWQASPRDVVDASVARIDLHADHFGQTGFEAAGAGLELTAPTSLANVSWTRSWGTRGSFDLSASTVRTDDRREPYLGTDVAGITTWEIGGDRSYSNSAFRYHYSPRSASIAANATVNVTTGKLSHQLRFGSELSKSRFIREELRNGGMTWRPSPDPVSFDPTKPVTWPRPTVIPISTGGEVRLDSRVENGALYLQDRIDVSRRLSVLLGARQGWWFGSLKSATGSGSLEGVRDFAVDPRLGAIVDVFGNARTVVKGHWGRFHQHLFAQFFDRVEGGGVFTNEKFWYYTGTPPATPTTTFTTTQWNALVANGALRVVQEERLNEEGEVFDYRQPFMDQSVLSIEQAIGRRWKADATWISRENKRMVALVDRNLATNFTKFENLAVRDRFGIPVKDQSGADLVLPVVYLPNDAIKAAVIQALTTPGVPSVPNFGAKDTARLTYAPDHAITTAPGARRIFGQLQLALTARYPLWTATGSLAFTKLEGNLFSVTGYDDPAGRGAGPYVRPNEGIFAYGKLPNSTDFEAKLRVSGALPWSLRGGAFLTAVRGDRYAPTFTHSGLLFDLRIASVAPATRDTAVMPLITVLPLAGQRVFLEPRGNRYYPGAATVDLHLERVFPFKGVEWVASIDGFNVTGESAPTEINTALSSIADPNATGPYGSVRSRIPPRTIRLGTAIRF